MNTCKNKRTNEILKELYVRNVFQLIILKEFHRTHDKQGARETRLENSKKK